MYNLELSKAIREIKKLSNESEKGLGKSKTFQKQKAKTVCIQLPNGLKPKAKEIADKIEKETNVKVIIWLNSCFGSCDIPNLKNIDLLIQWGHSRWH